LRLLTAAFGIPIKNRAYKMPGSGRKKLEVTDQEPEAAILLLVESSFELMVSNIPEILVPEEVRARMATNEIRPIISPYSAKP
jgi:hypothetical protein